MSQSPAEAAFSTFACTLSHTETFDLKGGLHRKRTVIRSPPAFRIIQLPEWAGVAGPLTKLKTGPESPVPSASRGQNSPLPTIAPAPDRPPASEARASAAAGPPLAGPPPVRKPALPALSGIRTVLAILILFFHFTPPHLDFLHPIIDNSFIFVGTFFLISGFILTYNYDDRATTLRKRDFWLARFARLYPTYIFVLLLSTPLLFAEWQARPHPEFWAGLLVTPLLLQGWSPSLATFWNTVAWTLSADLLLYLLFPYILRAWATRGVSLNTPARLAGVMLALWLIGLSPHAYYHFANPDHLSAPADRFTEPSGCASSNTPPQPTSAPFSSASPWPSSTPSSAFPPVSASSFAPRA